MKDEFKMTDLGRPEVILGLNIKYNLADGTILLNAETYISKLAKRFNFEHCQNKKSFSTPMETGCRLSIADEAKDEREIGDFPYSSLVASLLYIAVAVSPDIAFAVKELIYADSWDDLVPQGLRRPNECSGMLSIRQPWGSYTTIQPDRF